MQVSKWWQNFPLSERSLLSCDVCLHPHHRLSSVWPSQSPLHCFLPQKHLNYHAFPRTKTERRLLKKGLPFPVYSKVLLNTTWWTSHSEPRQGSGGVWQECVCRRNTIPVLSATGDFQSLLKVRQTPDNNCVASFLFISYAALCFLSALSENISEVCVFREPVRWTSKPATGSVVMPFEFLNLQHILTSACKV